jgi:hypothetical protein
MARGTGYVCILKAIADGTWKKNVPLKGHNITVTQWTEKGQLLSGPWQMGSEK